MPRYGKESVSSMPRYVKESVSFSGSWVTGLLLCSRCYVLAAEPVSRWTKSVVEGV